jgi:hypothetical protein
MNEGERFQMNRLRQQVQRPPQLIGKTHVDQAPPEMVVAALCGLTGMKVCEMNLARAIEDAATQLAAATIYGKLFLKQHGVQYIDKSGAQVQPPSPDNGGGE